MVDDHNGYTGHKVVSVLLMLLPLLATEVGGSTGPLDRLLLAGCGFAGAAIAFAVDRATWQEGAIRAGVGFATVALFVPYVAARLDILGNMDAMIALAGAGGIVSWYVMGSAFRFLKWLQASDVVGALVRAKAGLGGQSPQPPADPKTAL